MESFKCKGLWWIPEKPDNKIAGFLTFSQEKGFSLEIIGLNTFREKWDGGTELETYPFILGITDLDKPITLHNCFETGFAISALMQGSYLAHYGFLGKRFLSIAQALESFHRQLRNKQGTLKKRLEELFNETDLIMSFIISDKNEIIERTKFSRNYYTHYDKEIKEKAAKNDDLFLLTEILSILLESCLLNEIDIPQDKQLQWFERNGYYQHLKRQNMQKS